MSKVDDLQDLISKFSNKTDDTGIITGCLPIDLITGGKGLSTGITHLWSSSGFGKSTLMLTVARELTKKNRKTLYVASEPNTELAKDLGLENLKDNFSLVSAVLYKDLEKLFFRS